MIVYQAWKKRELDMLLFIWFMESMLSNGVARREIFLRTPGKTMPRIASTRSSTNLDSFYYRYVL